MWSRGSVSGLLFGNIGDECFGSRKSGLLYPDGLNSCTVFGCYLSGLCAM